MDCDCNCIDVQVVLPSIRIPVSLAFLNTQVLQFQLSLVKLLQVSWAGSHQVTRVY